MRLTKYNHACFTVEKDGQLLIVDPGDWSNDLPVLDNVVGIVVTHEHADHFDIDKIREITSKNPAAKIIAHEDITAQVPDLPTLAVTAGQAETVGPFSLSFFGGEHAVIHPSFPSVANLGVLINDSLYYPGDSFTRPERHVKVLALPAYAPWMKLSEAMDFCSDVDADSAFPTHDAILSDQGKALSDRMLARFAKNYARLTSPIDIDG